MRHWFKEDIKCKPPVPLAILMQVAYERSDHDQIVDVHSSGAAGHFGIPHKEIFKNRRAAAGFSAGRRDILPEAFAWFGQAPIGTVAMMPWGEKVVVVCNDDDNYLILAPAECVDVGG